MKGFYFINTDVRNTRAHTTQILNTASFIDKSLPISIVAPRYHREALDFEGIKETHGLPAIPKIFFLENFGIESPGRLAFALFNFPAGIFLLTEKLKGEKFFLYLRSGFFLPLVILARVLSIPIFYETHRVPLSSGEKLRDWIPSKLATGIVVISERLKNYYERYDKSILVVHDAVSLERFGTTINRVESRQKLGIPLDKLVCVYAGSVSRLKGLHVAFEAAKKLPYIDFVIAGPVSDEFDKKSLSGNMKLIGKKEQKELPPILKLADVLILPHPKGEYSQSPMKLFEYMASGVPIVSSRLPSLCEILNLENAILVEPEDAEALKVGIEKAVSNPSSKRLAEKALSDVKDYTWQARGKKVADFISEILK